MPAVFTPFVKHYSKNLARRITGMISIMMLGVSEALLFLSQNVKAEKPVSLAAGAILFATSLMTIGLERYFRHKRGSMENRHTYGA